MINNIYFLFFVCVCVLFRHYGTTMSPHPPHFDLHRRHVYSFYIGTTFAGKKYNLPIIFCWNPDVTKDGA